MSENKQILKSWIKVGLLLIAVAAMFLITKYGTLHSIKLSSFDNESNISFGTHFVKQKDMAFNRLNFKVANIDKFINEVLLTQDSFLYTVEDQHYTYYVFNNDGYYYIAYAGLTTITIENLVSEHDIFKFPFFSVAPVINSFPQDETETVHTWAEINKIRYGAVVESVFNSYEDVKAYYEKVNPIYWTADDENETIQIKVYQQYEDSLFGQTRISDDYYVTLVCSEAGVTILYDGHYDD